MRCARILKNTLPLKEMWQRLKVVGRRVVVAKVAWLPLLLKGRIAQLVERLSYTQVVIGSNPVAPTNSMRE